MMRYPDGLWEPRLDGLTFGFELVVEGAIALSQCRLKSAIELDEDLLVLGGNAGFLEIAIRGSVGNVDDERHGEWITLDGEGAGGFRVS
jgi:hypothetical protein